MSSRCTPAGRAADRWEKFGPLLAVGRSSLSADVVTVDGRRSPSAASNCSAARRWPAPGWSRSRYSVVGMLVEFESELWVWEARRDDSWTFVSLPVETSDEIRDQTGGQRRGFGSVRVEARVGTLVWRTSIFPESKTGAYVLPIKQAVRKANSLAPGDTVKVTVEILFQD